MNTAKLLTVSQVAELLGKNKSTIVRWCQAGKLKAKKLGNQWVIFRQSVEEKKEGK